jgi:hypothetical protein
LEFGDILGHIHSGVRLGFCYSNLWRYRRLSAKIRHPCDAAPPGRTSSLAKENDRIQKARLCF